MNLEQAKMAAFIVSPDNEWFRMNCVDGRIVHFHDEDTGSEYAEDIEDLEEYTAKILVDAPAA